MRAFLSAILVIAVLPTAVVSQTSARCTIEPLHGCRPQGNRAGVDCIRMRHLPGISFLDGTFSWPGGNRRGAVLTSAFPPRNQLTFAGCAGGCGRVDILPHLVLPGTLPGNYSIPLSPKLPYPITLWVQAVILTADSNCLTMSVVRRVEIR